LITVPGGTAPVASRYTIWWAAARAGVREVTIPVKHAKAVLNRTFEQALEALPELSIFQSRDHGTLLQIAGLAQKAVQYDIGNPNTASKMTRHGQRSCQAKPLVMASRRQNSILCVAEMVGFGMGKSKMSYFS
jgi:hypothetical protein